VIGAPRNNRVLTARGFDRRDEVTDPRAATLDQRAIRD
jgi:hypothetical protein